MLGKDSSNLGLSNLRDKLDKPNRPCGSCGGEAFGSSFAAHVCKELDSITPDFFPESRKIK